MYCIYEYFLVGCLLCITLAIHEFTLAVHTLFWCLSLLENSACPKSHETLQESNRSDDFHEKPTGVNKHHGTPHPQPKPPQKSGFNKAVLRATQWPFKKKRKNEAKHFHQKISSFSLAGQAEKVTFWGRRQFFSRQKTRGPWTFKGCQLNPKGWWIDTL